jgi:hypothetical protein
MGGAAVAIGMAVGSTLVGSPQQTTHTLGDVALNGVCDVLIRAVIALCDQPMRPMTARSGTPRRSSTASTAATRNAPRSPGNPPRWPARRRIHHRTPWLPLIADAETLCAQRQAEDPRSTLTLFRRLAKLRADTPALQGGTQRLLDAGPNILAWIREDPQDRLLAAVNFTAKSAALPLPDQSPHATLVVSTDADRVKDKPVARGITLGPS